MLQWPESPRSANCRGLTTASPPQARKDHLAPSHGHEQGPHNLASAAFGEPEGRLGDDVRVELRGFEPLTPWLQTRCSASSATAPFLISLRVRRGYLGGRQHILPLWPRHEWRLCPRHAPGHGATTEAPREAYRLGSVAITQSSPRVAAGSVNVDRREPQ